MLNKTLVIAVASGALKGSFVNLGDSGLKLPFDSVKDTKDGVMAKFTDGEGVLLFATLDSVGKLNIKYPEEEDSPKNTIEELCNLIYEDNKEKVLLSRETGNMFKLESVTETSMGIAVAFEHVYGMEGGDVLLLSHEFIEDNTISDVVSAVEETVEEKFVELVPKDTLTIPEDSEYCQCTFCTAEE